MLNTKIILAIGCLFFAAVSGNGQEGCAELNKKVESLANSGKSDEALELAIKAKAICLQEEGEKSILYAEALTNLAVVHLYHFNPPKALPLSLKARAIMDEIKNTDPAVFGPILSVQATVYYELGMYDKALPLWQQLLKMTEESEGKKSLAYGVRLNNLATHYSNIGEYEKAATILQEAKGIFEAAGATNDPHFLTILVNLGTNDSHRDRLDNALSNLLSVLPLVENLFGIKHPYYFMVITEIGDIYINLGQLEKAESLLNNAIKKSETLLGTENMVYARLLNSLGNLYHKTNKHEKAIPVHKEAIAIIEKIRGKKHSLYVNFINNLSNSYISLDSIALAITLLAESTGILKELTGTSLSIADLHIINNMALSYYMMEDYARADSLILDFVENEKSTELKKSYLYVSLLAIAAQVKEKTGKFEDAQGFFKEALEILRNNISKNFEILTEKEKQNYLEVSSRYFDLYHSFILSHSTLEQSIPLGYDNLLVLKSMILQNAEETRNLIRRSTHEKLDSLYEEWKATRQVLYKQYSLAYPRKNLSLDSLEERADNLERALTYWSSDFKKSRHNITWKEVADALHPSEAAIEFIHFQHYRDNEPTDSVLYAAYINKRGLAEPVFVPLFEQKRLERWLSYSGTSTQDQVEEWYDSDTLYQLIWKPLEPYLDGADTIYYSPSGLLHRLAFAAIRLEPGTHLSDAYQLQYVTSSREIPGKSKTTAEELATALVYGGIRYETDREAVRELALQPVASERYSPTPVRQGEEGQERYSLGFLGFSIPEMESVERILKAHQMFTMTLRGYEGLEESFKALGEKYPSPQIIHIPTHGFFFEPFTSQARPAANSFESAKDALLRCGLLLANADTAWRGHPPLPGYEDGILTGYEIANLDLSNTRLAILSACNTGRGEIKGGEGVYGLQRAFKLAGADWIIMTLWSITDGPQTVDFMAAFYRNWFSGMDIRAAFHTAQQEMKKKYQAPYYWAPFVLIR